MPWPINPRIRRWLDEGKAIDVLLGRGEFFVREQGYGDHDRILATNQLLMWAFPDHVDDAAQAVNAVVTRLLDAAELDELVDVIWSYVLVAEDEGRSLPVDRPLLDLALDRAGMAHLEQRPEAYVYEVRQRLDALEAAPDSHDIGRR